MSRGSKTGSFTSRLMRRWALGVWHGRRSFVLPLLLVVIWQIVYAYRLVSPTLLPSAWETMLRLGGFVISRNTWTDLGWTALRMAVGFGLAAIIGISVGLTMGLHRALYQIMVTPMDFFRSVPVSTLYPAFLLILGTNHSSKIGMVCFGSVFVVALNTAYGVLQANPVRAQMVRLFGGSRFQTIRWVTFFEALPQTMIGLRVSLSFSLVIEVLCEFFMGSEYGLGQRLSEAYSNYAIADMYAFIVIIGTVGFILNRTFVHLERRVVPWVGR